MLWAPIAVNFFTPHTNSGMSQEEDPFHLGNTISMRFVTGKSITGKIVYRDDAKIYLKSNEASDRASEFKFTEEGDQFEESYGITDIELIEEVFKSKYVEIFGITVGEHLEFFTLDGQKAAEDGVVKSIKKDSITLTDGRELKFRTIGPKEPIAVIRASSQVEMETPNIGEAQEAQPQEDQEAYQQYLQLMEMMKTQMPASSIEMVATTDLSFPESMQRSDLLQDIIALYKSDKSTKMTPHLIRRIEREVDVMFNLKQKMTKFDDAGNIVGINQNVITNFGDAIKINSRIPAAIPVMAGALVLNIDEDDGSSRSTDVTIRLIQDTEMNAVNSNKNYDQAIVSTAAGAAFSTYLHRILASNSFVNEASADPILIDQDVIRTAALDRSVQGFGPGLPSGAEDKNGIPKLKPAMIISNVKNRLIRLLKATEITMNKTGDKIRTGPSDPGTVLSYMILPAKMALALRPQTQLNGNLLTLLNSVEMLESDNLPTVTDALYAVSTDDTGDPLGVWSLTPEDAATRELAPWLAEAIKYTLHKADSLSPNSSQILQLLDSVGLVSSNLDLSAPIREIIDAWVSSAQAEWIQLMDSMKAGAIEASVIEIPGQTNALWALLRDDEKFKELQAEIKAQNPIIAELPSLQTAIFSSIFQGDYAPLVWSAVRKLSSLDTGQDVASLAAIQLSRLFKEKRSVITNLKLTALEAGPEINPCEHVLILEAIRNTENLSERSKLLNDFIEKYQGKRDGEWLSCNLCSKHAVCLHEIMELEMLAQPRRFEALQRQMFIRFGGERYLGSIVCRNCGQALKEIDFDDNVEFDDNGKPIVQNAVVTEEQMDEETVDEKIINAIRNEVAPELSFKTEQQNDLYDVLTHIARIAGVQLTPEIAREIVMRSDLIIDRFLFAGGSSKYNEARERAIKENKKPLPEFIAMLSRSKVMLIAAFLVIAIQTATPILQVSAHQFCKFSRGGYPLEDNISSEDSMKTPSAMLYIACCIGFIKRDQVPWKYVDWYALTALDSVRKSAYKELDRQLKTLFTSKAISVSPLMIDIKRQLTELKSNQEIQRERELISKTDELPPGFRPQPFLVVASDRTQVERPINANISDGILVDTLQRKENIRIAEMHQEASENNDPKQFQDFFQQIIPQNSELSTILLKKRINPPTSGTHLFSEFVPMKITESAAASSVDGDSIFRIFLRFCHSGPKIGAPHEIDVGNKCRQCGFVMGPPKDINDFETEADLIAYQKSLIKTEISAQSFNEVSNSVRRYGIIPVKKERRSTTSGLSRLASCFPGSALGKALSELAEVKVTSDLDETEIAELWGSVSTLYDLFVGDIMEKLSITKVGGKILTREHINQIFSRFDLLLADPWIEGPSQIQEYWCAKVSTAAMGTQITEVKGQIWSLLARAHRDDVNALVETNADWTNEEMTKDMSGILVRLSENIAPYIKVWKSYIRSNTSPLLTTKAAILLLKTIIFNGWAEALDTTTYYEVEEEMKETVSIKISKWLVDLIFHSAKQTIRFSAEEIKQVLQERAAKERVTIVKEFEDLKDDESRAVALEMKRRKIGRWGEGKNLTKYDKDRYLAEKDQRGKMQVDSTVAGAVNTASELGIVLEGDDFGEMDAGGGEFEGEDN